MKRSGRKQAAFTAGELASSVWERDDFKYYWVGLREAVNVDITPQGGLTIRPCTRRRAITPPSAARLFAFTASNGAVYDVVPYAGNFAIYESGAVRANVPHTYTDGMIADLSMAQQLDTGILTHRLKAPQRLKHLGPTSWVLDVAPFVGVPNYDYGGAYTNGVGAEWDIELIGFREGEDPLHDSVIFTLTVSGSETASLRAAGHTSDAAGTAATIQAAVLDLPNVSPGIVVSVVDGDKDRFRIRFNADEGDVWAVSGRVVNKADAAVVCSKRTPGVAAGEPIMSDARGWPRCAAFYQQRLLLGGFSSLPNTWMASRSGDYFNFDERVDSAAGPFRVPMDIPGGEAIMHIVAGRDLMILTNKAEYSIAERALSKTSPPVHVEASRNGARGRGVAENEGAVLFAFAEGGGVGELRWTDVSGNYVTGDLGLLAPHLVRDVVDLAVRGKTGSQQGNRLGIVRDDQSLVLGTLLRDQEVTAFTRVASDAAFKAVARNGRNELQVLAERPITGGSQRTLEAFEEGLLLDDATTVALAPASAVVPAPSYEGCEVWAIADGDVFGPYVVTGGVITIGKAASSVTIGRWQPPRITTLPLTREVGPKIVAIGTGRIHSVHLMLEDTTSIAISTNGKPAVDVPLFQLDGIPTGTPELAMGFTGRRTIRNLRGFRDDPMVTITQVRPGRLTLKSIVLEAAL